MLSLQFGIFLVCISLVCVFEVCFAWFCFFTSMLEKQTNNFVNVKRRTQPKENEIHHDFLDGSSCMVIKRITHVTNRKFQYGINRRSEQVFFFFFFWHFSLIQSYLSLVRMSLFSSNKHLDVQKLFVQFCLVI